MTIDLRAKKIVVTGGAGFLGAYVVEKLKAQGVSDEQIFVPRSKVLDLREIANCQRAVSGRNIVIHLAADVGGLGYNRNNQGKLFYNNMLMGANVIEAARREGVDKIVTLGSICSYPKYASVPFKEDDLWDGYPEETNAPYGFAKKMMLIQSQAYRQQYGLNAVHLLTVNLYGPRDNFDPNSSHVVPALIRKISEAQREGRDYIEVWGTGDATREFLYAADAAEGIVLATERYDKADPVNIGSNEERSIGQLVDTLIRLMGFAGTIRWGNTTDGQPRRRLDTSRAEREFGFRASTSFEDGLKATISWYKHHISPERFGLTKRAAR